MTNQLDLSQSTQVRPDKAPVTEPPPGMKVGLKLSRYVLIIISAFLVLSMGFLLLKELSYDKMEKDIYSNIVAKNKALESDKAQKFIENIQKQKREFRDFWVSFNKTVLINLLLPVLTALLGYTFATGDSSAKGET